jgi:hypothetical protein
MDALTPFGLFAVTAMLVCYALESRSPWFVLLFAASCALGSAYGFLQGAWPSGWSRRSGRWWRGGAGAGCDDPGIATTRE